MRWRCVLEVKVNSCGAAEAEAEGGEIFALLGASVTMAFSDRSESENEAVLFDYASRRYDAEKPKEPVLMFASLRVDDHLARKSLCVESMLGRLALFIWLSLRLTACTYPVIYTIEHTSEVCSGSTRRAVHVVFAATVFKAGKYVIRYIRPSM